MSFKDKKLDKKMLADSLGLAINTSIPLLALNFQYFNYDFEPELEDFLSGLKTLPVTLALKEPHNRELRKHFADIIIIKEDNWLALEKAADMMLFLSDDEHISSEMMKVMEQSVVPICYRFPPLSGKIINYDPVEETGNAFLFEQFNKWMIFSSVIRALETAKFAWDWQGIVRNGIANRNQDFFVSK